MGIRDILNKLRGNKSGGLVLPANLESIPMRDQLDENKIRQLDIIKKEFENILSQKDKNYFYSYNLTDKQNNDDMRMNFSLFGKLVIDHDGIYNLKTMEHYEKENLYVHNLINPIKIKLYIDEMEELYVSTHLRLIALKEIYDELEKKERKSLSRSKKEALVNEIYNLTTSYVIFKNNVYSALVEVETYKKELADNISDDGDMRIFVEHHDDTLSDYKKKVAGYAKWLIPDKLKEIEKKNLSVLDEIAHIERELEIYTYNNIEVDDLNKELENIDSIPRNAKTRDILLKLITELETKFIVLNDYGKYELDLKPLYEVKFDILTTDIVSQQYSPFDGMPRNRERIFYEDILASQIVTNITGVDSLLSQWVGKQDPSFVPKIIELVKNVLFISEKYDYDWLLDSRMNLALILSMESREKVKYFFDHYMLKCLENGEVLDEMRDCSKSLRIKNDFFNLKPGMMSLISLCKLYSLLLNVDEISKDIYGILTMIYDTLFNYGDELIIPEGIERINLIDSFYVYRYNTCFGNIRNSINNKELIMPSTLRSISFKSLDLGGITIPKIVLNEGLESINGVVNFVNLGTKSLTIPSTLESYCGNEIYLSFIYTACYTIPELIFTNYESSKLLESDFAVLEIVNAKVEHSVEDMRKVITGKTREQVRKLKDNKFHLPENSIILVSNDGTKKKTDIAELVWNTFIKFVDEHNCSTYSDMELYDIFDSERVRDVAITYSLEFVTKLGRMRKKHETTEYECELAEVENENPFQLKGR